MPKLLLFGASGQIGQALQHFFELNHWAVDPVARSVGSGDLREIAWNVLSDPKIPERILANGPYDAICWAQGVNLNDSIYSYQRDLHQATYEANVLYILESLSQILKSQLLARPARLCVISSIWQEISRQNKLSYAISKSALRGLVLSLANDLAKEEVLVNAILPGALDTPMTRQNLSLQQIHAIEEATQFGRLPNLADVVSAAYYVCSEQNTGVTGQFLKVDLGFSDVRNI
jgi:NAD(P)-dependent dehydrogenase (short-subunit alcohol dehydrogenase family)